MQDSNIYQQLGYQQSQYSVWVGRLVGWQYTTRQVGQGQDRQLLRWVGIPKFCGGRQGSSIYNFALGRQVGRVAASLLQPPPIYHEGRVVVYLPTYLHVILLPYLHGICKLLSFFLLPSYALLFPFLCSRVSLFHINFIKYSTQINNFTFPLQKRKLTEIQGDSNIQLRFSKKESKHNISFQKIKTLLRLQTLWSKSAFL